MSLRPGFEVIGTFSDRIQADLAINLLKGCGFHVDATSDDAGGGITSYNAMTIASGIAISVLEGEAHDAKAVLNAGEESFIFEEDPSVETT